MNLASLFNSLIGEFLESYILKPKRIILGLVLIFISFVDLNSTIIIPPSGFEEMLDQTEYVVYGKVIRHLDDFGYLNEFEVASSLKGNLSKGDKISLQEYGFRIDDLIAKISGDTDFEIDEKYLLFLWKNDDGFYKTNYMSLSVYKEGRYKGHQILAHTKDFLKNCIVGDLNHDLKNAHLKNNFLKEIKRYLRSSGQLKKWETSDAGIIYDLNRIDTNEVIGNNKDFEKSLCPNSPPSHCTTLFGSPSNLNSTCTYNTNGMGQVLPSSSPGKYLNSSFVVKVASGASNDPSISNELDLLSDAVEVLNGFEGIDVVENNPVIQTCTVPSCNGGTFFNILQGCNNNPNDIWVFFDDPCNMIPDLSNCNGQVGLGGSFVSSQCHTDCGNKWLTNSIPFFIMNNGAGCQGAYSYTATLIHEILHSIGLDHIGTGMACSAIMNPIGCSANAPNVPYFGVTDLDTECIEWMYNIGNNSCDISNFSVSNISCSGSNVSIPIQFDVVSGSGNYNVFIEGNPNPIPISGVSNGTINHTILEQINPGNLEIVVKDQNIILCESDTLNIAIPNCNCSITGLTVTNGPTCNGANVDFGISFMESNTSGTFNVVLNGESIGTLNSTSGSFTVNDNQGQVNLMVTDVSNPTCSGNTSITIQECPTCNDGEQNQGETGVDCGGPCTACPTCNDGIQNQGEAAIDCGGPCPNCPCTDPNDLTYSNQTIPNGTDEFVNNWIKTVGIVDVNNGSTVELRAGNYIEMMPGFEIKVNSSGSVLIDTEPCNP